MRTWIVVGLLLSAMGACAPYPYYGDGYYDGYYHGPYHDRPYYRDGGYYDRDGFYHGP